MEGENLRDSVVEVAFEQRTQRQFIGFCPVGFDVFPRYRDTISDRFPYWKSAETWFLNLGGTADLFALSFYSLGLFILS